MFGLLSVDIEKETHIILNAILYFNTMSPKQILWVYHRIANASDNVVEIPKFSLDRRYQKI